MVRLLLRHLLFELLVSLRFEDGCSTMFHLLWSCEVTISNSFMDPGSCWIHIIFVYLALSAAKQLSRSCILNHANKFRAKWLRIYVVMTFKPHSHCLALSQVNNLTQYMQNSLASTKSDRQSKTKHWHQWGSPLQLSGPAPDFHTVERECASIVCLKF